MLHKKRDCYIIFLEEFSRLSDNLFDDVKIKIEDNYSRNTKPLDFLIMMMSFLISVSIQKLL